MKRRQAQLGVGVLLVSIVLGLTPVVATAATYVPLGDGQDRVHNGIPIELWGVWVETRHTPGYPPEFIGMSSWDLSAYGTAKELHIVQYCAWADNVPTGITVGHITVFYQDESTSTLDLVVGVNTAEWSYDCPCLVDCLQHAKIPEREVFAGPASDPAGDYDGHQFYVSIPLDAKPLDRVELVLDPASYTGQSSYGCGGADWFGVTIDGLTIEYPPIPATLDISPDPLNLASNGKWITAYLSLPEGFDVADIDPASIRLNGVIPAAWSWIDEDTGILTVKFARAAVAEIVEPGEVQMTVTGIVGGDTKFQGTDVIKVISPVTQVGSLVVNGSFEVPLVEKQDQWGRWDIFPSGTPGLGWTVEWVNAAPGAPTTANLELQRGIFDWQSYAGSQYAELDSDWYGPNWEMSNPASVRIYQDISTRPGRTYTLSYAWSPRPGQGDNQLAVYWNGKLVASHSASGEGKDNTTWTVETLSGLAPASRSAPTTRLEFVETGNSDSWGMFLDAVSVTEQQGKK